MFPASNSYFNTDHAEAPYWPMLQHGTGTLGQPGHEFYGGPLESQAPPDHLRSGIAWPSVGSPMPTPSIPSTWLPENQKWLYMDPNGVVQGPFAATAMQAWYEQQYLYSELLVRPEEDPEFRPLHLFIAESGDMARPFLVPPRRPARHLAGPVGAARSVSSSPFPTAPGTPSVPSPRPTHDLHAAAHAPKAHVSSDKPDPAATQTTSRSVHADDTNPSNLSANDIAATVRVMTHLQSMMASGAPETQTLTMMHNVLANSLPHANAAGMQDLLAAIQSQAAQDAARASQAQESADSQAPVPAPASTAAPENTHATKDDTPATEPVSDAVPAAAPGDAAPEATKPAASAPTENAEKKSRGSRGKKAAAKAAAKEQAAKMEEAESTPSAVAENNMSKESGKPRATAPEAEPEAETKPSSKPAPWATPANKPSSATPNMRQILEAEQRDHAAQDALNRAANSALLAKAMAQMQVGNAPPASQKQAGAAWNLPRASQPAKSLSQIQQEESARAAQEKSAQAARPAAYASSAQRAATTTAPPARESGWVKVTAAHKTGASATSKANSVPAPKPTPAPAPPMARAKPAAAAAPPAPAPTNEWTTVSGSTGDGWVTKKSKHQVRRDALSQMNDAIPRPPGQAAGLPTAPSHGTTSSVSAAPLPPSHAFLQYCRDQLKGLRANVDDFIEMLLSFPLNPSPDVADIIAEAVYANSSTLDGRRFAADFIARRKADAHRGVTI